MFESLPSLDEAVFWVLISALALGAVFGFAAERGGSCLRAAVEEWVTPNRRTEMFRPGSRTTQFFTAVIAAILVTQLAESLSWINTEDALQRSAAFAPISLVVGGLLFGFGMVLAGGCVSRITVLTSRGNLRSLWVLILFSLTAYASMTGVLSPLRLWLQSLGAQSTPAPLLADLSMFYPIALIAVLAAFVAVAAMRRQAYIRDLVYGVLVGLMVPIGWWITTSLADDGFTILQPQSMNFTNPAANLLQYVTIASSIAPNYGVCLMLGTLGGSFVSALIGGRLYFDGFGRETEPLRYGLGAILMGIGGVAALGCSLGQGLTGMSLMSTGSMVVFAAIIAGAAIALRFFPKRR